MRKRQTKTIFHRRSRRVVTVGVLAWLGVLIAPCTVALSAQDFSVAPTTFSASDADHHDRNETLVETNDECHGGHATLGPMESGCCCDVTVVSGADSGNLPQYSTVFAAPIDQPVVQPRRRARVVFRYHGPSKYQSSQPVYLSTQRFRI